MCIEVNTRLVSVVIIPPWRSVLYRPKSGVLEILYTKKFSPPTGGFFLALAEGQDPLGTKVILPDGRTNGQRA